ncbi:MAG: PHP domain-containing protein [Clostridia bacterium]|nr:PHP domain-containing protein [Clostridia bacterium]
MIIDLHSHTNYSWCGKDEPQSLVEEMIRQGVQVLGITDHQRGIGEEVARYCDTIRSLAKKYEDRIRLFCGIELCTLPEWQPKQDEDFAEYDYCLIENLSDKESVMDGDLLSYIAAYKCPVGIAHTDLFSFIKDKGWEAKKYLQSLAERGVFWELNVNYDSIHGYIEHAYVKEFMQNEWQQALVKEAGLAVSIGFDGHRMEDYLVERVGAGNAFLQKAGIKNAVQLITNYCK